MNQLRLRLSVFKVCLLFLILLKLRGCDEEMCKNKGPGGLTSRRGGRASSVKRQFHITSACLLAHTLL